ncbi:hypothetical protein [Halalkalibacter urbisdiaboli]|uniref:hypothetical protein n=1 Tax=Halalkalibacter urbisdiaboli TaxID=1960589 RepID=UPI000B432600|nr:hypothetical protein [Halalkalibacter urbisdiaboli]
MRESIKYLLVAVAFFSQIGGIILLFFNQLWALYAFLGYGASLGSLLILFILERRKEKKEEIDYEDCHY